MFEKRKNRKKKLCIRITKAGNLLYQGHWNDLPLGEEMILQKSVEFFDDPTPCFIHREAVRVRLLAEMEEALQGCLDRVTPEWLLHLAQNMGQDIDQACFYEE